MKQLLAIFVLLAPISGMGAVSVFKCGEPRGISMWSNENHKPAPDGFRGVQPRVTVDGKEMTISWGDTKLNPGAQEKVWKTSVFYSSPESVSGVALDAEPGNTAATLYTIDMKRGYLYMSTHKNNETSGISTASTYVSKCGK
jgi:hypothetical protein